MYVNISPDPSSNGEPLCSLRFAARVNACEFGIPRRQTSTNLLDSRLMLRLKTKTGGSSFSLICITRAIALERYQKANWLLWIHKTAILITTNQTRGNLTSGHMIQP